jgi:hypothetical protein
MHTSAETPRDQNTTFGFALRESSSETLEIRVDTVGFHRDFTIYL